MQLAVLKIDGCEVSLRVDLWYGSSGETDASRAPPFFDPADLELVGGRPDWPVTWVSWDNAQAFCAKSSAKEGIKYRLPTEAEWEYACRAGTTTPWSFGDNNDDFGDYGWTFSSSRDYFLHHVGQKKPNPFGLFDMHGNAAEWCQDIYTGMLPGGVDPLAVSSKNTYRGKLQCIAESPSRIRPVRRGAASKIRRCVTPNLVFASHAILASRDGRTRSENAVEKSVRRGTIDCKTAAAPSH
ncbi:MAG TPA: formylglycine-generating enzyme family protein [Planctomycetaceae bacterium]|nr:formylglycine-generating enzyme family protein [Planctomycetaceae bacterium]